MIRQFIRPPQSHEKKDLDRFFEELCKFINTQFTATWDYPMQIKGAYIWQDETGDMRIDTTRPTAHDDGTVIGGQS